MKVLAVGDVFGDIGCEALRERLPACKRDMGIDLVIANGENSAGTNGILPRTAEHLFTSGVDVITGGNHTLHLSESYNLLNENERVLRPANMPDVSPGHGMVYVDMGYCTVAVINLIGVLYLRSFDSPFQTADRLVNEAKSNGANVIIIDFHAEATSEKRALGFYLDGRISALFGTHTHVATADEQILPHGTGYISDIGMSGPVNSVLGADPAMAVERFLTAAPVRFKPADGPCAVNGCVFDIDIHSGKTVSIERVSLA